VDVGGGFPNSSAARNVSPSFLAAGKDSASFSAGERDSRNFWAERETRFRQAKTVSRRRSHVGVSYSPR